ncbi:MAG: hypothetical protein KJ941_08240 [Bacteroidetes bacterium]|nr:hypothetical protein [Bacteroidota bacterium]
MIKKIAYFLLTILALGWIVYASGDIVASKNKNKPNQLFGPQDGRILVINQLREVRNQSINFNFSDPLKEIVKKISTLENKSYRYYFSENQSHFAIESTDNWEKKNVLALLNSFGGNVTILGVRSFRWNDFEIKFSKNVLNFQKPTTLITKHEITWDIFDKNASYSIVAFKDQIPEIKEFYIKDAGTSIYSRVSVQNNSNQAYDDREMFANYLPTQIDSYNFRSIKYALRSDSILKESPFRNWPSTGYIALRKDKKTLFLFDIPTSLTFSDYLLDARLIKDPSETSFQLSTIDNQNEIAPKTTFYYKQIENFVYISESTSLLAEVDSDIKLGKTLSTQAAETARIFDFQAKSVMERTYSKNIQKTVTLYRGYQISKEFIAYNSNPDKVEEKETTIERKTFDAISEVQDFAIGDERQGIVAVNSSNEVLFFKESARKTIFQGKSNFVGPIKVITEGKFKDHFLVTFKNEFILVLPDGSLYFNKHISMEQPTNVGVNYFSGAGQEFFVAAPINGGIVCYSTQGQKIKSFDGIKEASKKPIDAWTSQNKIFLGLFDGTEFHMINYQKNRIYRSFKMDGKATSSRQLNELIFYTNVDKQLHKVNQKGQIIQNYGMTVSILENPNGTYLLRLLDNKMQFISLETSETIKNTTLKTGENVDAFDILDGGNNQIIAVLDGISNKIRYFNKAKTPSKSELVGKKKVILSRADSQKTYLYTLNDTYIVRYELPL